MMTTRTVTVGANGSGNGEQAQGGADWPAFFDLPSLVEASDVIVVAQLGREETETIEVPAEEGGEGETTVTEIVRTFVIEETIKGDLQRNDLINVFNTANVAVEGGDGSVQETAFQVLRMEEDQSYLLFLTLVEVPDYYPEDLGEFGWAAPGEPHTARVSEAGQLQWETTGRYDDAMEERGIEPDFWLPAKPLMRRSSWWPRSRPAWTEDSPRLARLKLRQRRKRRPGLVDPLIDSATCQVLVNRPIKGLPCGEHRSPRLRRWPDATDIRIESLEIIAGGYSRETLLSTATSNAAASARRIP
ncbi:MAG: hypothetical protein U5Q44_04235 [Dehalococcoidia bacterium]|nr:hypothetical protein [Dehalococcoidia bacterium]